MGISHRQTLPSLRPQTRRPRPKTSVGSGRRRRALAALSRHARGGEKNKRAETAAFATAGSAPGGGEDEAPISKTKPFPNASFLGCRARLPPPHRNAAAAAAAPAVLGAGAGGGQRGDPAAAGSRCGGRAVRRARSGGGPGGGAADTGGKAGGVGGGAGGGTAAARAGVKATAWPARGALARRCFPGEESRFKLILPRRLVGFGGSFLPYV